MRVIQLLTLFILLSGTLFAQCSGFPATLAESNCGSGTALSSGANMNSGTYSFCGPTSSSVTFTGLNLAGATLTICGNASLSGNWNSGNIIVSCGSTVNFPSGLSMSQNVRIINYGRINVTGDLNLQNNGICVYNESVNSSLYVSGNVIFPQNNSDASYIRNNGYISVGGTFDARSGAYVCFSNTGKMLTNNLNYGTNCGAPSHRFTFSSANGQAIIRVTGTANLRGTVTSSANYAINLGTGATVNAGCGSWGSAVTATNSPAIVVASSPGPCVTNPNGCFTVLPVELAGFEALAGEGKADLFWVTESELNNDHFAVLRSGNAADWETIGKVQGAGSSHEKNQYHYTDHSPLRGLSYYRLVQTDTDGKQTLSEIRSVVMRPEGAFVLYPNPTKGTVSLLPSETTKIERILIMDGAGRVVFSEETAFEPGELQLLDISALQRGMYVVTAVGTDGVAEQQRLIID